MIFTRWANQSIKYGIWTSSRYNNSKFRDAYKQGPVYFFFTPRNSGRFYGVAQMTKPVKQEKEFAYWGEIGKWKGLFGVEWIFVRDLYFDDIENLDENGEKISELKDGSMLSMNNAVAIVERFNGIGHRSDIFSRFANLDKKENDIRGKADAMIMTGMYDIYAKEQEDKKNKFLASIKDQADEVKEEPAEPVMVVKKKLTQGQLKKLKKQQGKEAQ